MTRRYEPYAGYADYGDEMEGKMMESNYGQWVRFSTHTDVVAQLNAQIKRLQDKLSRLSDNPDIS